MVRLEWKSDWGLVLARQVDELGPIPRGRFLAEPDDIDEQVSGERLLESEYLRVAITRARPAGPASGNPKDLDPRIGVSRMSRQYCASLTCAALAGLANGVGLDLSPERCVVIFRDGIPSRLALRPGDGEVLRCAERPTSWPVSGRVVPTLEELRGFVWNRLYARNLRPMFGIAVGLANVPERLLWTNAAEWIGIVMDSAAENLEPEMAERVVGECQAVLDAEVLPGFGGERNPLRGRLEWVPFDGGAVPTRHLCCLVYLHTDRRGRLCQNCPLLPLPDRAALVRERRRVGIAKAGGPAERRGIEVGLRRRHC